MTVRVSRSFDVPASPERVWEWIADPEARARAISVVSEYSITGENRVIWEVSLPLPLVSRTITVETRDVTRRPPEFVEFVGDSRVFGVTGTHETTPSERGCRLENTFVVDGKLPGVERFFERNLDDELENLRFALERDLATEG